MKRGSSVTLGHSWSAQEPPGMSELRSQNYPITAESSLRPRTGLALMESRLASAHRPVLFVPSSSPGRAAASSLGGRLSQPAQCPEPQRNLARWGVLQASSEHSRGWASGLRREPSGCGVKTQLPVWGNSRARLHSKPDLAPWTSQGSETPSRLETAVSQCLIEHVSNGQNQDRAV